MTQQPTCRLRVAIGGLGAVGGALARRLDAGIPGLVLAAVSARDRTRAAGRVAGLRRPVPVVPLDELAALGEVIVECAPAAVFDALAEPAVAAGRRLIVISAGALLDRPALIERARETGARIIVPSGALLGLDALRAAAEGEITSVRLVTRKPPAGLAGAPYLADQGLSLDGLEAPLRVFAGTAREGVRHFPANVNVAAALSLAGIGAERTELEIWADPGIARNCHRVEVEADSARFTLEIENVPSEENPRTGRITALSVIAALRRLTAPLQIGT